MSKSLDETGVYHGSKYKGLTEKQVEEIYNTEEFEGYLAAELKRMIYIFNIKSKKQSFSLSREIWVFCQDNGMEVPEAIHLTFLEGVRKEVNKGELPNQTKKEISPLDSAIKQIQGDMNDLQIINDELKKYKTQSAAYEALAQNKTFGVIEAGSVDKKHSRLLEKMKEYSKL